MRARHPTSPAAHIGHMWAGAFAIPTWSDDRVQVDPVGWLSAGRDAFALSLEILGQGSNSLPHLLVGVPLHQPTQEVGGVVVAKRQIGALALRGDVEIGDGPEIGSLKVSYRFTVNRSFGSCRSMRSLTPPNGAKSQCRVDPSLTGPCEVKSDWVTPSLHRWMSPKSWSTSHTDSTGASMWRVIMNSGNWTFLSLSGCQHEASLVYFGQLTY